jgi:hypothetical protein
MKKRMATWGFVFAVFGWIIGRGKGFDAVLDVMAIDALLFGALGLGIGFYYRNFRATLLGDDRSPYHTQS